MNAGIILAAGRGERMGAGTEKAFLELDGLPLIAYSLKAFDACGSIDAIVVVAPELRIDEVRSLCAALGIAKTAEVVAGGSTRQRSVMAGLAAIPDGTGIVAIHDAARVLVTPALIDATVASAREHGSGIAAGKVVDTLKVADGDMKAVSTVDRTRLWAVATPQAFPADEIRNAYADAARRGHDVTDDAGAFEACGRTTRLVEWREPNFKITFPEDLGRASAILRERRRTNT